MSAVEAFDCVNCSESFAAHPDGNAAATGYCSPACHTAGEGLG